MRRRVGESASCMFLIASSTIEQAGRAEAGDTGQDTGGEQAAAVPVEFPPARVDFSGDRRRPSRSPCSAMMARAAALCACARVSA